MRNNEVSKGKILFIEDDENFRLRINNLLTEHDYDVTEVENGSLGKKYIEDYSENYDLFIIDVVLPEGTFYGFKLSKIIKKNPIRKDIPIIFLTNVLEEKRIEEGFVAGGLDYIKKDGFIDSEFLMRVKTQIDLYKKSKDIKEINNKLKYSIQELREQINEKEKKKEGLDANHINEKLDMIYRETERITNRTIETTTTGLIIFIHGLAGSNDRWAEMIKELANDKELINKYNICFHEYRTKLLPKYFRFKIDKLPNFNDLINGLVTKIKNKQTDYSEIILVAHSMGGLILRAALIKLMKFNSDEPTVKKAILYATPNNGSKLATIAKGLKIANKQIKMISRDSVFFKELDKDWMDSKIEEKIRIINVKGDQDIIITDADLTKEKYETVSNQDHFSIAKPKHKSDDSFILLKKLLLE